MPHGGGLAFSVLAKQRRHNNAGGSFRAVSDAARLLASLRQANTIEALGNPAALVVKREDLLRSIRRSQARDKYCWTLPAGLISFSLWCLCFTLHANVPDARIVEASLAGALSVSGFIDLSSTLIPIDTGSFYSSLLTGVGAALQPDDSGVTLRYNHLLGGVRVSQSRSNVLVNCSGTLYTDIMRAVVGVTDCHPETSGPSTTPFWNSSSTLVDNMGTQAVTQCSGDYTHPDNTTSFDTFILPPTLGPAACGTNPTDNGVSVDATASPTTQPTVASVSDVTAAFAYYAYGQVPPPAAPSTPRSQAALQQLAYAGFNAPFHYVFDYYVGPLTNAIAALQGAGWIDDASRDVTITVAVVNLELGLWARALFATEFTRGGQVLTAAEVRSMPVDPYIAYPGLPVLDAIIVAYVAVFWVGLVRTIWKRVARARALYSRRGKLAALLHLFGAWFLVDLATGASLVATLGLWVVSANSMSALRSFVTSADWSPGGVGAATFASHAWLETAIADFYAFKIGALVGAGMLMTRLFWLFSLQPKLAVLTEAMGRSVSDLIHFAIVFTVIMVFYGVWGYVFFGSQCPRWSTPWSSANAVIDLTDYEYDLIAMRSVDDQNARWYFGTFMFLITNLLLWMFLAIIMDTYGTVRVEVEKMPSAAEDFITGAQAAPQRIRRAGKELGFAVRKLGLRGGTPLSKEAGGLPSSSRSLTGGRGLGGAGGKPLGPFGRLTTALCAPCSLACARCCRRCGKRGKLTSRSGSLDAMDEAVEDEEGEEQDEVMGPDGKPLLRAASAMSPDDIMRVTTPRGSRGKIGKVRARRVVDVLESDGLAARESISAGDIAALAGIPLKDTIKFLRRFLGREAVPEALDPLSALAPGELAAAHSLSASIAAEDAAAATAGGGGAAPRGTPHGFALGGLAGAGGVMGHSAQSKARYILGDPVLRASLPAAAAAAAVAAGSDTAPVSSRAGSPSHPGDSTGEGHGTHAAASVSSGSAPDSGAHDTRRAVGSNGPVLNPLALARSAARSRPPLPPRGAARSGMADDGGIGAEAGASSGGSSRANSHPPPVAHPHPPGDPPHRHRFANDLSTALANGGGGSARQLPSASASSSYQPPHPLSSRDGTGGIEMTTVAPTSHSIHAPVDLLGEADQAGAPFAHVVDDGTAGAGSLGGGSFTGGGGSFSGGSVLQHPTSHHASGGSFTSGGPLHAAAAAHAADDSEDEASARNAHRPTARHSFAPAATRRVDARSLNVRNSFLAAPHVPPFGAPPPPPREHGATGAAFSYADAAAPRRGSVPRLPLLGEQDHPYHEVPPVSLGHEDADGGRVSEQGQGLLAHGHAAAVAASPSPSPGRYEKLLPGALAPPTPVPPPPSESRAQTGRFGAH